MTVLNIFFWLLQIYANLCIFHFIFSCFILLLKDHGLYLLQSHASLVQCTYIAHRLGCLLFTVNHILYVSHQCFHFLFLSWYTWFQQLYPAPYSPWNLTGLRILTGWCWLVSLVLIGWCLRSSILIGYCTVMWHQTGCFINNVAD